MLDLDESGAAHGQIARLAGLPLAVVLRILRREVRLAERRRAEEGTALLDAVRHMRALLASRKLPSS